MAPVGKPLQHASADEKASRQERVSIVAFSPDGAHIVTAGGENWDDAVRLWDAATQNRLANLSGAAAPAPSPSAPLV